MKDLAIDIETYSSVSIADCGAYKYCMSPDFEILLVAYAIDDEPTQIIDVASGEAIPIWFMRALQDPNVTKHAHNATFERICFTQYFRRMGLLRADEWLDPFFWECSMVKAARCGLPMSLKDVGKVLKLEEQKMDEGKALIQLFCTPRKRHAETGSMFGELPERVQPDEYPDKWETFKEYCIRDVNVERRIVKALEWYKVSDFESELYAIDQTINDRGVRIDMDLVREACRIDAIMKAKLSAEAVSLTGLSNPNSGTQLKGWLEEQLGVEIPSVTKTTLPDIAKLAKEQGNDTVLRVLRIRAELGKTSNAKYTAMTDVVCADDRARGLTQFYGSRTGRWAGRLIQMQNLPQNHIEALDGARQLLKAGDWETLDLVFGNVPDTMSQLIRTAFIPSDGKLYAVCDFSAIEARVLAWIAGEDWVLDTFRQGGDIYCATASQMFHVPVEKHGQNAHLRQRGKVAVLALGYGGGVSALDKMGGARLGMSEQEEADTVKMWRNANPNIVDLWRRVENAAKECIVYKRDKLTISFAHTDLTFRMEGTTMTIELPSGRRICYPEAEVHFDSEWACTGQTEAQAATDSKYIKKEKKALHPEKYYKEKGASIRFKGTNQETRKWEWIGTWGGKLVENITQAVARDCLAETMTHCEKYGFPVVFHIHDELVMEVNSENALKDIQQIFTLVPEWAKGLPLRGAGYTGKYYFKD